MITDWIRDEQTALDGHLERVLPAPDQAPVTLHRAMRYSVFAGGKRLRPLLCRAAARAVAGGDVEAAWAPACALELIHTYSLIHDDLPALDNDDLRRGRPTCHKAFGEATAIVAGDGLLTLAFEVLASTPAPDAAVRAMLLNLARAAGTPAGMVAGQAADLDALRTGVDLEAVRAIHRRKTGALIRAAIALGGLAAGAGSTQLADLDRFGEAIGLAFQIVDDLLDRRGTAGELGKTAGKDDAQAKATYPALAGDDAAERDARQLTADALAALAGWSPSAERLRELARRMAERRH